MLSDPQTITIDAVPYTFNCVEPGETRSVYKTADAKMKLTVSHLETRNGRARHLARLDVRTVAADPLTAVNAYKDDSVYFVIDRSDFGMTNTVLDNHFQGLVAWATTAIVNDILEFQH